MTLPPAKADRSARPLRALVFLSAFLLFASEPLVGQLVLPSAGGGTHVWATLLMFFQGALLVGYLYCHWVAPRLGRWHLLIACLPLALMPLSVSVELDPAAPVMSILSALLARVALPFTVLSTTAVLAQTLARNSETALRDNPYALYSVSNAGSLAALVAYPLLLSPFLTLRLQTWLWTAGYLAFVALLWRCLRPGVFRAAAPPAPRDATAPPVLASIPTRRIAAWLLLSAAPAALLLAVTNVIEQDVGSAPLVWVVPLALYLASFVLVFRTRPVYPPFVRRFWLEIAVVGLLLYSADDRVLDWWAGLFHLGVLLAVSTVAHSALYDSRPPARQLTTFYIVIAIGGWLGAAFVVLVAPRVFHSIAEYPVALVTVAATLAISRRRELVAFVRRESRVLLVASAAFVVFAGLQVRTGVDRAPAPDGHPGLDASGTLHRHRNAYGIYRVTWLGDPNDRTLHHGTTVHGRQNLAPALRRTPLGYYARETPLGDVLPLARRPRRAAVVGLGAGAMAAYFGRGEAVTFFELDPHVVDIARTYFTYLEDCEAEVHVVVGDGRIQLARNDVPDGQLDVLVVDAFSSDSIPTHLLTREAVQLYLRKLAPHGYLVFHISSRYHDLRPVLRAVGDSAGAHGAFKDWTANPETASTYFVLARDPELLTPLQDLGWTRADVPGELPRWAPWTDDYVNLLRPILANL